MTNTTETTTRSLGVMIDRITRYGSEYVTVRPMVREGNASHPLNCCYDHYSNTDAQNLAADLLLNGFVSDINGTFLLHDSSYSDIGSSNVDLRRAQTMVKGLRKLNNALTKADAREPGDVFVAYCRAIGVKWVCWRVSGHNSTLRDNEWNFTTIANGKHRFRSEIAAAKAAWSASHPGKAA
jgi:hypothetical protein